VVASGECGQAVGAAEVAAALRAAVAARRVPLAVVEAGCTGMCYQAVQVTLQRPGAPDLTWDRVEPGQATALVAAVVDTWAAFPPAFAWSAGGVEGVAGLDSVPFLAGQQRILLEHAGRMVPADVDEALVRGGYQGLAQALARPPEAVIDEVKRAGLAGRGGAYFPTGVKWEYCHRAGKSPRYVVVNAEEGEPGLFKDRHLLTAAPHLVVEGALIAAYAVGAERVFFYVNGQAQLAQERLTAALRQATARGLLGRAILGSAFTCAAEVRVGGGGYVLGEETALLESLEGRRPMPRPRPPHTVEAGLWGCPTIIDNVETLACVPFILARGADWFRQWGTARFPGTKLLAISGDIARPGLVEVAIGTSLRRVLYDLAGGVPNGRALQAVLTEGPSGDLLPPDRLDVPLEPKRPDVLLGSGNLVALDTTRRLLDVIRRLTRYNAEESCGKCTPCREGVNRMWEILERIASGRPRAGDRTNLLYLADIAAAASLCGLGQMAPRPVLSALRYFHLPELEALPGE